MVKNILGAVILCIFLIACGGGGSGQGVLVINLTDAPATSFAAINVTVYAVRIHTSADAGGDDADWHQLTLRTPVKINLLNFQDGVLLRLGQLPLPAGRYQQIRLLLVPNSGGTPPFNDSVVQASGPQAGAELPLDIRPEDMTGIKIIRQFTVSEGDIADLTLDIDGNNSVIRRGDGTYMLLPVVTATVTQSPVLGVGGPDNRGDEPGEMGDNLLGVGAGRHQCAVLDNGQIKCWGDNASGQLGTAAAISILR